MIPGFVIFLREGVEGSMVVAILLAYLARIDRREHFRDVFLGVGAALALALVGGLVAYVTIRTYAGSTAQTIFETATYLLATALLTYMTFWMRAHARHLSRELHQQLERAMGRRARWSLGLVAFQAVGREGLETVVFTLALVFTATLPGTPSPVAASGLGVLTGGALGLLTAIALAYAVYRMGRRLNLQRFFQVLGACLIVFAAGLLADSVENLQQLGWLTLWRHPLWSTAGALSEASPVGDVLHTFFGYADRPTLLQLAAYVLYLAVTVVAFLGRGPRRRRGALATG